MNWMMAVNKSPVVLHFEADNGAQLMDKLLEMGVSFTRLSEVAGHPGCHYDVTCYLYLVLPLPTSGEFWMVPIAVDRLWFHLTHNPDRIDEECNAWCVAAQRMWRVREERNRAVRSKPSPKLNEDEHEPEEEMEENASLELDDGFPGGG